MKRLVLAGAGHAHLEVLRCLAASPVRAEVVVITAEEQTIYSGMMPGLVAGHYIQEQLAIPVRPLAEAAGAQLVLLPVVEVDAPAQAVRLADGRSVAYDFLSLDVGSTPSAGIPEGDARHVAVKPLHRFLPALERAEERVLTGGGSVGVVGGGVAGVEIALALHHRYTKAGAPVALSLLERGREIVSELPAGARRRLLSAFRRKGIEVRTRMTATDGYDLVVWATGGAAPAWLGGSGLATDERGFVQVNEVLRSLSHPEVFAAGDVAALVEDPRPKAGVIAVRQGPVLGENLRRAVAGEPGQAFRPPSEWLTLVATGPRHAVAARNGLSVSGRWVWRWKDHIDRTFVRRYKG